eukprot:g13559.t1
MVVLSHTLADPHLVQLNHWLSNRTLRNFLQNYSENVWPEVVKMLSLLGIYALQYSSSARNGASSVPGTSPAVGQMNTAGERGHTPSSGSTAPAVPSSVVWSLEDLENLVYHCANEEEWPSELKPELFRGISQAMPFRKPNAQWRKGNKAVFRPRGLHDKSTPTSGQNAKQTVPTQAVYEPDAANPEKAIKRDVYPTWWPDGSSHSAKIRAYNNAAEEVKKARRLLKEQHRKTFSPIKEEEMYSGGQYNYDESSSTTSGAEYYREKKAKERIGAAAKQEYLRNNNCGGRMAGSRAGGGAKGGPRFPRGDDRPALGAGVLLDNYSDMSLGLDSADCIHAMNECTKSPKAWSVSFPANSASKDSNADSEQPSEQEQKRTRAYASERRWDSGIPTLAVSRKKGVSAVELAQSFMANPALRKAFASPLSSGSVSPGVGLAARADLAGGAAAMVGRRPPLSPSASPSPRAKEHRSPVREVRSDLDTPLDERRPRPWAAAYNMHSRERPKSSGASGTSDRRGGKPPNSFVAWNEAHERRGPMVSGAELETMLSQEELSYNSSVQNYRA